MTRFALFGLLLTILPAAALADPRSATVTVTAADMSTPAARARLDRRIGAAIEQVCGSYAMIETGQVPEMDSCWAAAKAEASRRLASLKGQERIQFASH